MKNFIIIFSLFTLTNCGLLSSFKVRDAFQAEHIGKSDFKTELPFQFINGAIIVEVMIDGKPRNFIFDTGASTILDDDLAKTLKFETLGKIKTFDSNRKKRKVKYVRLDEISVGAIEFYDIVASISDIEALKTAMCLDISGILGANVMNKGIWQIDFQNQKIIFTDNQKHLNLSGKAEKINFYAFGKGVPFMEFFIGGVKLGDVELDTGFNGAFDLDESYLPDNLLFMKKQVYISGVYGAMEQTQKIAKVPSIRLGETMELKDAVTTFSENKTFGYVGTRFLQDYLVTIDWQNQTILLEKNVLEIDNPYRSFGFHPRLVGDKLFVGSLYIDSPIYKKGLRLNDEILKINDVDFTQNAANQHCSYLHNSAVKDWENINLTILRNGETITFEVERMDVF